MVRHFILTILAGFLIVQVFAIQTFRLSPYPPYTTRIWMSGPPRSESPVSVYEKLVDSMLDFSISSYMQISRNKGYQENIVFSPFSIYSVLMMAHLGARGPTAQQICQALKICQHRMFQVHEAFGAVVKDLLRDSSLQDDLAVSSSLFIQRGMNVSHFYRYALSYIYNSTLKEVEFSKNNNNSNIENNATKMDALDEINLWVKRETRGKIPLFMSKAPSEMTRILMANAVHFRSDWKYQFDPRSTELHGYFFVTPHLRIPVPMMTSDLTLAMGYSSPLATSILELPFSNSRISMFVCLPDTVDGLDHFQRNLNSSSLKRLISTMRRTNVTVRIPRFNMNQNQASLPHILWTLGIRDLFSPGDADLSGISEYEPLHISNIIHTATIQVDEKGSVASAATGTVVERIGSANQVYFEANHPFLFFIMDKQSGTVLFIGKVARF